MSNMASTENRKRAVAAKLQACIESLVDKDRKLFALYAREETITHKLAEYLTSQFLDWDVDRGVVPFFRPYLLSR